MDALDLERGKERRTYQPVPGQVIDVRRDSVQTVGGGEGVEQAGAKQGRVGIVDEGRDRNDRDPERRRDTTITVRPGDVLGKARGSEPAGGRCSEPDRGFLAFSSQADQLDLKFRAAEVRREVAGRAELDGSAWGKSHETAEGLQARSVTGQASRSLLSRGSTVGINVDPGTRRNWE